VNTMKLIPEQLQLMALLLGAPQTDSLPLLEVLAEEHPWLASPLLELRERPLQQWQGEHTALFVNGYPKTAAPPFLSALQHGQMGGGIEEELHSFYLRLGLAPDGMPADYLGTLFECTAWLLSQQPVQQGQLDELWQHYLLPVLPDFAQRLIEHGGLSLYLEMGKELARIAGQAGVSAKATA